MTGVDVMTGMFRRTASALAGLLGLAAAGTAGAAPLPMAKPEAAGFSAERLRRLDETMQTLVDQGQIAGGVTVLGRHGRVVSLKAFGKRSLETGEPMPADAISFNTDVGAFWIDTAGRRRDWVEWREWIGRRAGAGKLSPKGFPTSKRFRPK
jgi:hypothetical protein